MGLRSYVGAFDSRGNRGARSLRDRLPHSFVFASSSKRRFVPPFLLFSAFRQRDSSFSYILFTIFSQCHDVSPLFLFFSLRRTMKTFSYLTASVCWRLCIPCLALFSVFSLQTALSKDAPFFGSRFDSYFDSPQSRALTLDDDSPSSLAKSAALPLLTLQDALSIALENNYSIRLARNALNIADNNADGFKSLGAAGMLPVVNLNAAWSESSDNVRQEFFNGNLQERLGARTDRTSAVLQLNWTLFDGLLMFAEKERLSELQKQNALALRQAIETTVAEVMTAYVTVVEQNVLLAAQKTSLDLSRERLRIAEAKARLGSASELDAQNARVDYNADSAMYLRQEAIMLNAKTALGQILGNSQRLLTADFRTEDSLALGGSISLSTAQEQMVRRNTLLRAAGLNTILAQIAVRQAESFHYPTLNATLNYNVSVLDAEAGILKTSQTNGLSFGLTTQVNIFNGWNTQRQIENAKVETLSAEIQYLDLENRLNAALQQAHRSYANSVVLAQLERDNARVAKAAADVALERFRIGSMNSLDLRLVQQNYIRAESRYITALADAKRAEVEIMRLTGELTRE
jgi:outer membrane protein TolC